MPTTTPAPPVGLNPSRQAIWSLCSSVAVTRTHRNCRRTCAISRAVSAGFSSALGCAKACSKLKALHCRPVRHTNDSLCSRSQRSSRFPAECATPSGLQGTTRNERKMLYRLPASCEILSQLAIPPNQLVSSRRRNGTRTRFAGGAGIPQSDPKHAANTQLCAGTHASR
jgi:hypothetical protein